MSNSRYTEEFKIEAVQLRLRKCTQLQGGHSEVPSTWLGRNGVVQGPSPGANYSYGSVMPIQAAIFDAFGTLLRIKDGSHPYRQLIKIGKVNGRKPRSDDASTLMRVPMTLSQAARHLGIPATPEDLKLLERALEQDIAAIEPYPDGLAAVQLLQLMNVRVGVCSNLAFPYRQAILRCYPDLDVYALSCELGMMKPDPLIYEWSCDQLGAPPRATWMIGDSIRCDKIGPEAAGIGGFFLDRVGGHGDYAELLSFAEKAVRREA